MPAKKTDWKRERKQLQDEDGTVLLERGTRTSVENRPRGADNTRSSAMIMADMQSRQAARRDPGISKTMRERLCGLFGGERCRNQHNARAATSTGG